jgi:hypothetical protein
LNECNSTWKNTIKGVPQGSILGPLVFNIFMNDIFYFTEHSSLYNYADDNTLSFANKMSNLVTETLEKESKILIEWFKNNQMQANPDKFQAIAIGKKSHNKFKSFNINNNDIPCDDHVKLLGVDIDHLLNFDLQISNLCKKAARQLNVLQRLSKYINFNTRLLIFKAFIRSNFNYCPLIWHFCSKANTDKLERLQYRALKIVFNDYISSYDSLLQQVNLTTLHLNRLRAIATQTFKCIHNLSPTYLNDLVKIKNHSFSFRYTNMLEIPTVRTTRYGEKSFRFEAARVWNSLPEDIRRVDNYKDFSRLVHTWTGSNCTCALCR